MHLLRGHHDSAVTIFFIFVLFEMGFLPRLALKSIDPLTPASWVFVTTKMSTTTILNQNPQKL